MLSGFLPADNITATYTTTATQASPVGVYSITATLNDPSHRLANYAVTQASGQAVPQSSQT